MGRNGEARPGTHHGTPKYGRPRWCRRARSGGPGCRNRHWIERRFQDFPTEQFRRHRCLDHHAACIDDDVLRSYLDHCRPRSCRPVLRTGTDPTRAPRDDHGGMCNKGHHGDRYHVECLGCRYRWPGNGHARRGFPECAGDRGRVPRRGRHLPRRHGHSFEGRVIDASDDDVDDSRDDPFDHSPDNIDDDNDWWHRPGRGVTARLGVGWGLSASSRTPVVAGSHGSGDLRSPRSDGIEKGPGFVHSHRRTGNPSPRAVPRKPLPSVAERNVHVITMRRSTVVRVGVAALVLAALGIGFAVGMAISSPAPSTSTVRVVTDPSVASVSTHSTATTPSSPVAPTANVFKVVSCRPGAKPQVRPRTIDIGCAGDTVISAVTWSSWGRMGNGSGTLTLNNCQPSCAAGAVSSSPAFVVVSDPVGGVFQNVVITPPTGALSPKSSSHPGSGWGSG